MSGRLSLAVTGIQDQWMTGEPQFSYFLMNFRRHTKFSIEHIETPFDGSLDFDREFVCRLPHSKGDLVKNMTLKITLQDPGPDTIGTNNLAYVPSVCTELIEYVDLMMGGQTIERLTGEYIFMHQQLNNSDDDVYQSLYFLNGHGGFLSYEGTYTYFLDLPFYFYRHPSLAIPMCTMTKQLVEVRVKLRSKESVVYLYPYSTPKTDIKNLSLDTEFVFVSEEEKNFLTTRPIEHVITQLQMSQVNIEAGLTKKSIMLNFKHPVKEMFFIAQSDAYTNANSSVIFEDIKRLELKFNNQTVFNIDTLFMNYVQTYKNYVNVPYTTSVIDYVNGVVTLNSIFGAYSFSNNPEKYYPTGQVNMSRISHKLLDIEIEPFLPNYDTKVRVYAVNYNVLRFDSGLVGLKF
jgi:hypothetical protein